MTHSYCRMTSWDEHVVTTAWPHQYLVMSLLRVTVSFIRIFHIVPTQLGIKSAGTVQIIYDSTLREIARVTLQSVLHHVCIRHTAWVKSLYKACSSTCVQEQARHTAWVKMVNSCYCFEDAKKKSMGNDYVQFRSISHRSGTCGDWREILSDYLLWFIQFPRKGPAATEVGCYRWYFESWPELLADQNMKCWDSRNVVRDSKFEFEM